MSRVLIIDDDSRNIFALTAVLKSKRFETVSAGSAADGLSILADDGFISVVLLDMMMPEMDGYETIKAIRRGEHRDLPVIAVTAQAMVGDKEKCLEAGANAYLSKPIDVDQLVILLHRYIS